ncbi:MAG: glycosyltransferase family 2 protein [Jatrophihabitans sp.]|uniref:glycosyltransferase family 2 protein n=1 Tax=Jatrophihabitans sp. TaxID=1932789 RepID=UPI003F7D8F78
MSVHAPAIAARPTRLPSLAPTVSIVVPAKNEARNLEIVLPQLPDVHEVILVDGNSTDDTVETARRVRPGIKVVRQTRRGKGNALACGFAAATGDIIVMFDADCSADPAEIPAFVDALILGADFAKGSRFTRGGGSADITRLRRAGNWFLNLIANSILDTRYTDLCYGYNAFWAHVLDHLELPGIATPAPAGTDMVWGDGFEIETVINCRIAVAGLRIAEVPSFEQLRVHGESNLNAVTDGLRVLRTLGTERRRARRLRRAAEASTVVAAPERTTAPRRSALALGEAA